jgi:uncharacterized NAD-dependent epimerase/dehydratase family protein
MRHVSAVAARTNDRRELPQPYLLFLGDTAEPGFAKTAFGLRAWAPQLCIGQYSLANSRVDIGLPELTPVQARNDGARALVIGVANSGGVIAKSWIPALVEALHAGLDIVSGMHMRLGDIPELRHTADRHGRKLVDVRTPPDNIPIATGLKRSGKRLLTVGTDCALGKKYTALSLTRAFVERGRDVDFRATGQTGIMISGSGIAIDAVVSDFAAGAAEMLSPAAPSGHWDVIEGQGSILHPAYAGVSLALLHGSQPDVFVVCHDPSRMRLLGDEDFAVPSIEQIIDLTVRLGSRTNPKIRCGGVALNTSSFSESDAADLWQAETIRLGLPAADPIRGGAAFEALVENCLAA